MLKYMYNSIIQLFRPNGDIKIHCDNAISDLTKIKFDDLKIKLKMKYDSLLNPSEGKISVNSFESQRSLLLNSKKEWQKPFLHLYKKSKQTKNYNLNNATFK